ncbi:hypothetical protein FRX31_002508 [Thalictrum thalictroides]|uniref:Uncharacterized protein n=1 Tax=Thalictrum thalictroides TaxID=46969 RepID=A0A7J6XH47_THATH|nr:hypothetical protein FRX31_002508 [Thalictrum thalictroides]
MLVNREEGVINGQEIGFYGWRSQNFATLKRCDGTSTGTTSNLVGPKEYLDIQNQNHNSPITAVVVERIVRQCSSWEVIHLSLIFTGATATSSKSQNEICGL